MRRTALRQRAEPRRAQRVAARLALAAVVALVVTTSTHSTALESLSPSAHARFEAVDPGVGVAAAIRAHDAAQCSLCAVASQSRNALRAPIPHSALSRVMHLAALPRAAEEPLSPPLTEAPPRAPPALPS